MTVLQPRSQFGAVLELCFGLVSIHDDERIDGSALLSRFGRLWCLGRLRLGLFLGVLVLQDLVEHVLVIVVSLAAVGAARLASFPLVLPVSLSLRPAVAPHYLVQHCGVHLHVLSWLRL